MFLTASCTILDQFNVSHCQLWRRHVPLQWFCKRHWWALFLFVWSNLCIYVLFLTAMRVVSLFLCPHFCQ